MSKISVITSCKVPSSSRCLATTGKPKKYKNLFHAPCKKSEKATNTFRFNRKAQTSSPSKPTLKINTNSSIYPITFSKQPTICTFWGPSWSEEKWTNWSAHSELWKRKLVFFILLSSFLYSNFCTKRGGFIGLWVFPISTSKKTGTFPSMVSISWWRKNQKRENFSLISVGYQKIWLRKWYCAKATMKA